jgi:hypothetical protein
MGDCLGNGLDTAETVADAQGLFNNIQVLTPISVTQLLTRARARMPRFDIGLSGCEQQYVVKFFTDEGMQGVEIISRLRKQYGDHVLSRTHVALDERSKDGKTNCSMIASPKRELDEGFSAIIAGQLDAESYLLGRILAPPWGLQHQQLISNWLQCWE